jgi:acylphosphatase
MAGTEDMTAVEARITGRVQGVWFRAWTRDEARQLGLGGWVRNEPDGSVRALFVGPRDRVGQMLARCRIGPPMARVDQVSTTPQELPPDEGPFRVLG